MNFLACFLLALACVTAAPPPGHAGQPPAAGSDELRSEIDQLKAEHARALDAAKVELHFKDLEARLADQSRYIEEIKNNEERYSGSVSDQLSEFGTLVAFFAILITVSVLYLSLRVRHEAITEAQKEARSAAVAEARTAAEEQFKEIKRQGEEEVAKLIKELRDEAQAAAEEQFKEIKRQGEEEIEKRNMELREKTNNFLDEIRNESKIKLNLIQRSGAAQADFGKAVVLQQQGKLDEAIGIYGSIIRCLETEDNPELREGIAAALVNRGVALVQKGDPDAAITTYDDVVKRFQNDPEPVIRELVARALFAKGLTLGQKEDRDAAIATYDDVVKRFQNDPEPTLRKLVSNALCSKANSLTKIGRTEDAIACCSQALAHIASLPEADTMEVRALAHLNIGEAHEKASRWDEAKTAYQRVIGSFADSQDSRVQEWVNAAREGLYRIAEQMDDSDDEPPDDPVT